MTLSDVNTSALEATVSDLKSAYPKLVIESLQLDVCDDKAVNDAVEHTVSKFGRIDVAVNVAGIGGKGKATHEEGSEEDWSQVLNVNLNGVWKSQKAELQAMLKQE